MFFVEMNNDIATISNINIVINIILFSLIHLEELSHLARLKKQLEQAQPSKKLNMNQVKKKKIT